jgi:cell division protein FtsB
MKINFKKIIGFLIFIFIASKICFFVLGIKLSEEIKVLDNKIKKVHQENIELEKEVSFLDSYQYAASQAADLGFIKEAQPIYLENFKYALKN